jgi:hypothetical protein
VALVIAAIIGAIVLAVISPSDAGPSAPAIVPPVGASPEPQASPADTQVPTERLVIVTPISETISEVDIEVTVAVPEVELPRKQLQIVILRNGERVASEPKFKSRSEAVVGGVRLLVGVNELTAALEGPGGLGPLSEAVVMTVDREAPTLAITAPKHRTKTFQDSIEVTGTSEPRTEVRIRNATAKYDQDAVVGPNGTYKQVVPLKKGDNRIVVTSTNAAGIDRLEEIKVIRQDGKPVIELKSPPKTIKRSTLPAGIKLTVHVTDAAGADMAGAVVSWSLGGARRLTEAFESETNTKGRSTWPLDLRSGDTGPESLLLTVEVTSPFEMSRSITHEIEIS